ncbi:Frataxin [Tuber magnatum]|uniref:ferroxidase n=1 Tax=Tuber magnatum TaxID=42249 RepID=A0A317SHK8_9PEZI|nr:Frataxin [Tuber magnatum]
MHQYHGIADESLEILYGAFEALAEDRDDVDVDFNSGVLTFAHPNGIYAINKQPPIRQIWLSSPVSGPKHYQWDRDDWVSARDGSRMRDLLEEEIGIKVEFVGLDPMNS